MMAKCGTIQCTYIKFSNLYIFYNGRQTVTEGCFHVLFKNTVSSFFVDA